MGKSEFGIKTLKVIHNLHKTSLKSYVVLMRHSARNYGTAENDELMELTEEGKQSSFEFGKGLPANSFIRFFSSPVQRCVQTSDIIEKGFLSTGGKTQANTAKDILAPLFVKDVPKIMQMAYELVLAGNYPKFFRDWFDGKIPTDLIEDGAQSAQKLLTALLDLLDNETAEDTVTICVTHDWHLVLLKEYYLGQKAEDYGVIEYLEGLIIYNLNENYQIIDHEGKVNILNIP